MVPKEHPSYEHIKSSGGIDEYRLKSNDLTVLLMEDHSAPVVTFMVTYRVGSRHEHVGYTGATHMLEHLMFKGSKDFNKQNGKQIWKVLKPRGASLNATTWLDRTNYYEMLPSEYLADAMAIEADRMRHALLRQEDRDAEMTVVRNEYERGENDPYEALDKAIWAEAYRVHPYHYSTIGLREDIEGMTMERLKWFYDLFYWPNNATASVIGDFDRASVFDLLEKQFGQHGRSPEAIPSVHVQEPEQKELRRVTVRRAGEIGIVGVAHKTPRGLDPDMVPLQVLSTILGGGKSSHLYRALVDTGLASRVMLWDQPFHDPGLIVTYAFLTPGTSHEQAEEIIVKEYASIKEHGVTEQEVRKAKAMAAAALAFSRDGSYAIAANLNEAIALGDWTFYTTATQNIMKVTAADVQRVAAQYLTQERSTTGYFIPSRRAMHKESHGQKA